jgi:LacI family transcriptional regulator
VISRPTITQLASQLGVAPSTVSRAFTRPHLLRPDTVERVLAAAKAVGYAPNNNARALSTGKAGAIGLIVPDIANPFFPPLIRAAQNHASAAGLSVFLADSDEDPAREERLIIAMAPQVEGLLVVSSRLPSTRLRELAGRYRIVLINRDVAGTFRVLLDATTAIRAALVHLEELGHTRIAYVGGPERSWSNRQRRAAVELAARERGLDFASYSAAPGTYESARALSRTVVAKGATGVIAFDDVLAHGLMGGFAEERIRVPEEVSIIGCDDALATTTFPALSTISFEVAEAAGAAVAALTEHATEPLLSAARVAFDGALVLRGTTGPAKVQNRLHQHPPSQF